MTKIIMQTMKRSGLLGVAGLLTLLAAAACGPDTSDCRVLKNCIEETGSGGSGTGASGVGGSGGGGGGTTNRANGESCSAASECSSGMCIDAVCCASACDGVCESCALSGSEGSCTPAAAATDPDGECAPGTCDGSGQCATGEHVWSERSGDSSQQVVNGLGVASDGTAVFVGGFSGQMSFGATTLDAGTDNHIFAVRVSPNGGHIWSKRFGYSNNSVYVSGAALDGSGNTLMAGRFFGSFGFPGGSTFTAAGPNPEIWIAKIDAAGNHSWSKRYVATGGAQVRRLVGTPDGGVVTAGTFYQNINLGTGSLTASGNDGFIAKHSSSGSTVWSFNLQSSSSVAGPVTTALSASADRLAIALLLDGTITLGGQLLSGPQVVATLDSGGNVIWHRQFTASINGVALDAQNNVFLTGSFSGTTSFGGPTISATGSEDAYVAKLDANGDHVWSTAYGDSASQQGMTVSCDAMGNVIVAGSCEGGIDMGGGILVSAGSADLFVAKLSGDGTHLWSFASGDAADQDLRVVSATDGINHLLIAGGFRGTMDLRGGSLNATGTSLDAFLGRLSP